MATKKKKAKSLNKGIVYNPRKPASGKAIGIDPKTGKLIASRGVPTVTKAKAKDIDRNVSLANTSQTTDEFGNVTLNVVGADGKVIRTVGQGQPLQSTLSAFQQGMGGYDWDLADQVAQAQDANFNYFTKDYRALQAQEVEDTKQELANKGIPMGSKLYDNTMDRLDSKWQGNWDQARNQAINAGNQTLTSQAGVQNQNIDTLAGTAGAFTSRASPYQATQSNMSDTLLQLMQLASGSAGNIYGIDAQKQIAAANRKSQEAIAAANRKAAQQQSQGPGVEFHG